MQGKPALVALLHCLAHLEWNVSELKTLAVSCRYEDFLDSKVTSADLFYLDDAETARQLAQLRFAQLSSISVFLCQHRLKRGGGSPA